MHFFYGDTRCLVLRQVAVPIEKRIKVVPPEVHAECLFVHLVLLKACAEGGHLRGPPEPLVDVGGRLQSRHLASLPASWREICAMRGSPAVLTERRIVLDTRRARPTGAATPGTPPTSHPAKQASRGPRVAGPPPPATPGTPPTSHPAKQASRGPRVSGPPPPATPGTPPTSRGRGRPLPGFIGGKGSSGLLLRSR